MYIHIKVRVQKAIRQETGSLSVKGLCVHVVCARVCIHSLCKSNLHRMGVRPGSTNLNL